MMKISLLDIQHWMFTIEYETIFELNSNPSPKCKTWDRIQDVYFFLTIFTHKKCFMKMYKEASVFNELNITVKNVKNQEACYQTCNDYVVSSSWLRCNLRGIYFRSAYLINIIANYFKNFRKPSWLRKTFKPKRVSKMARQYNTQQDGFDNIPGRSVYHVVQQVAHAKPVAQHQPIFYGIICNSKVSFMKEKK